MATGFSSLKIEAFTVKFRVLFYTFKYDSLAFSPQRCDFLAKYKSFVSFFSGSENGCSLNIRVLSHEISDGLAGFPPILQNPFLNNLTIGDVPE